MVFFVYMVIICRKHLKQMAISRDIIYNRRGHNIINENNKTKNFTYFFLVMMIIILMII